MPNLSLKESDLDEEFRREVEYFTEILLTDSRPSLPVPKKQQEGKSDNDLKRRDKPRNRRPWENEPVTCLSLRRLHPWSDVPSDQPSYPPTTKNPQHLDEKGPISKVEFVQV